MFKVYERFIGLGAPLAHRAMHVVMGPSFKMVRHTVESLGHSVLGLRVTLRAQVHHLFRSILTLRVRGLKI